MTEESKLTTKISPLGYVTGFFMGSGIILGYLAGSIAFILYLLVIIARTYIWIDRFSVFGIGWGVVLGLLAALGAIAATIVGLVIVNFVIRKIREYRETRK